MKNATNKWLVNDISMDPIKFREIIFDKLNEKKEKAKKLVTMKEGAKLSKIALDSEISFSPFLKTESVEILSEIGKIITSVNYRGQRDRELQKRPGFVRQGYHYVPETASQRIGLKLASKKRIRTLASKGVGFKRRIQYHMRLAWKKRKSLGLQH